MQKILRTARSRSTRIVVAIVALATAATALSGCAGGGTTAAATSKTLTIGSASAPVSLDPTKAGNGDTQTMAGELGYASLIQKNSKGEYVPGLASSWDYVPNSGSKKFEVTVRSGAKFADGEAVTPKAVADSINYYVKNSTNASFTGISATVEGDDKVLLTSATPNPIMPELLTPYNNGGFIMSPKGLADPSQMATATFGAGPFVYDAKSSVANDYYTFVKNKNYYDAKNVSFDKVVLKVISNTTSALQALRTGQIDVFLGEQGQMSAAKAAKVKVISGPRTFAWIALLDLGGQLAPALANVQVRQALNYAVDRKSIAKAVYGDLGQATDQPNMPGWDAYDKSLESTYSYDPAKAKEMLAAAGYPKGFSFTVGYASYEPDTTKVVQAVAEQLSQVGVTMNLTALASASDLAASLGQKNYSGLSLTWGGQTQYVNTKQMWTPNAMLNLWHVEVPGLSTAFDAYLSSTDSNRTATAQAVQKVLVDQAVSIPVASSDWTWYYAPSLKGLTLDPTGQPNDPSQWSRG